jgi:hypothetical protein
MQIFKISNFIHLVSIYENDTLVRFMSADLISRINNYFVVLQQTAYKLMINKIK